MARSRQIKLLTFASDGFYSQQRGLIRSAYKGGISDCTSWNPSRVRETDFYRSNRAILDVARGSGYWLWKPYLIRRELDEINIGDFLVYYDVGRPSIPNTFSRPLHPLLSWCEKNNGGILPGVYVPEHGRNAKWTKRECFTLMACDEPRFWNHSQVQATYSVWQKNPYAVDFADAWLKWCATPGVLSDSNSTTSQPNFPDFVDHRHDQSVITNLAIKYSVKCYGDPFTSLPGSKDINNLVDRIAGRHLPIVSRNIRRFMLRQFNSRILGL